MRVELGPVPAASARAWIVYARRVLATQRAHDAETLPEDLREGFLAFLDEWEAAATGAELRWDAEVDTELIEYLVHGFYRVATRLVEEAGRYRGLEAPPEGDVFYRALVEALLDAMANEGTATAEFAEQLRDFWPGLGEGA